MKCHVNASSGIRVVPCVWTDTQTDGRTDRQTERTKFIVTSRNFANVSQSATTSKQILLLVKGGTNKQAITLNPRLTSNSCDSCL